MKRAMIVFLVLAFASGLALAQAQGEKSHDVTGEVVKTDAAAKTITLKAEGKDMTLAVEGDAATQLKDFKAGDRVTVSCRDDASGAHKAITKIVKAKAT
jgi:Cu/Ag efflux protein CusF